MAPSTVRQTYSLLDTVHSVVPHHDLASWPRTFYRQTPRVDLAKLYSDTLQAAQQAPETQQSKKQAIRHVTFTVEPPVVHEYEQVSHVDDSEGEDDEDSCDDRDSMTTDAEIPMFQYPFYGLAAYSLAHDQYVLLGENDAKNTVSVKSSNQRLPGLDLRPVPNLDYRRPTDMASPPPLCASSTSLSSLSLSSSSTSLSPASSTLTLNVKTGRWTAFLNKLRRTTSRKVS